MRRKHPDAVIRAMATLGAQGVVATLLMIGTGEMAVELRELAAELGVNNIISGASSTRLNYPGSTLRRSVVLPSENEPWGLIVNEVMCAGIPVIVSEEVGCVADLVKDGVNCGFRMKAGDIGVLAAGLRKLLTDEPLRLRMGASSLSIIRNWSYEQCRIGILAALTKNVQK